MEIIAFTITLPDWLINGHFWAGFATALVLAIAFMIWAANQMNPWR